MLVSGIKMIMFSCEIGREILRIAKSSSTMPTPAARSIEMGRLSKTFGST